MEVLQDRKSTFELQIIPKRQKDISDIDREISSASWRFLCDAVFSSNVELRIVANGLNEHTIDCETSAFEQKAVVIDLNHPVDNVANTVKAEFGTEFVLSLFDVGFVNFARFNFGFVNAERFHEFERAVNFQVTENAVIFVDYFAEEVELTAGDVVLEPFLLKNFALSMAFVDGMNSLPVNGVKHGRRVDSVIGRLLEKTGTDLFVPFLTSKNSARSCG